MPPGALSKARAMSLLTVRAQERSLSISRHCSHSNSRVPEAKHVGEGRSTRGRDTLRNARWGAGVVFANPRPMEQTEHARYH